MKNQTIRTYSELIQLSTFEERLEYLRLHGKVGADTFGFDRYLNQLFYTSMEWRKLRDDIIVRDNGCDLAIPEFEIVGRIYIHHLNPLTKDDIIDKTKFLLNPEYLVCTSFDTHQIIHYDNRNLSIPRRTYYKNKK